MKKSRKNRSGEPLFIVWCGSVIIIFTLFLLYWVSVNKLILLTLITALLYQFLKRYSKRYLGVFYVIAISINVIYALVKLY